MRGSMKNNWKNKMMQFMQGRYGADQMGQMLSAVSMVFLIISLFSRNQAWFLLAVIGIVYNYFRMFSKNISKRYAENQKYLKMTAGIRRKLASWKSQLAQRKIYHIYRCPGCQYNFLSKTPAYSLKAILHIL